jgi:transposase
MGLFHSHPRTRMRALAIVRLSQGLTQQQVENEFAVHLNSVERWRQRWNKDGLAGLYERHHSGRPPKWNEPQQQVLRDIANRQGGSAGALLRHIGQSGQPPSVSVYTIKRYLKNAQMRYKRCRCSKKTGCRRLRPCQSSNQVAAPASAGGACKLFYFDESGFSPNPPI